MTTIVSLPAADQVYSSDLVPVDQSASGIARTAKATLTQLLQALPSASSTVSGTVKVGNNLTMTNGVLSATPNLTNTTLVNPTINGSISVVDPAASSINVQISGAPSNQKRNNIQWLSDQVVFNLTDDTNVTNTPYLQVRRTGTTPTQTTLTGTSIVLAGNVNVVGGFLVNGSAVSGGGTAYSGTPPITVSNGVISVAVGTTSSSVAAGNHTHSIYEQNTNKGVPNGYASLDNTGKVPTNQLPASSSSAIAGVSVTTGATYVMQPADRVVDVNKGTGSATAITLPSAPTLWVRYDVIDGKGDAATNPITVTAPGGTIEGGSSFTLNQNNDAFSFMAVNTTTWRIV